MGDSVVRFAPPVLGGEVGGDCPDFGMVGQGVLEFYKFLPPPISGFQTSGKWSGELDFGFKPRSDKWSEFARRRILLSTLGSAFEAVREIGWCGRRYRVLQVLGVGIVGTATNRLEHLGQLCVRLVVKEIKE